MLMIQKFTAVLNYTTCVLRDLNNCSVELQTASPFKCTQKCRAAHWKMQPKVPSQHMDRGVSDNLCWLLIVNGISSRTNLLVHVLF